MEEKELIVGKIMVKKPNIIVFLLCGVSPIILSLINEACVYCNNWLGHRFYFDMLFEFYFCAVFFDGCLEAEILTAILAYAGLATLILAVVWYCVRVAMTKCSITVTNKCVYGIAFSGKRVDLPMDSISAVSTGILKGIAIATSSGMIKFLGVSNRDEVHKTISNLLIERQSKTPVVVESTAKSDADELKKYKELLDSGILTQEEFNAKKKQILGL